MLRVAALDSDRRDRGCTLAPTCACAGYARCKRQQAVRRPATACLWHCRPIPRFRRRCAADAGDFAAAGGDAAFVRSGLVPIPFPRGQRPHSRSKSSTRIKKGSGHKCAAGRLPTAAEWSRGGGAPSTAAAGRCHGRRRRDAHRSGPATRAGPALDAQGPCFCRAHRRGRPLRSEAEAQRRSLEGSRAWSAAARTWACGV